MTRFTLTRGADSLAIGDRVYRARGNLEGGGHIDVDDRHDAAAIRAMGRVEGTISGTICGPAAVPERYCPACGFCGYAFQTVCPKCGAEMGEVEE